MLYSKFHRCPVYEAYNFKNFIPDLTPFKRMFYLYLSLPFHRVRGSSGVCFLQFVKAA
jgi:hypothetical protein